MPVILDSQGIYNQIEVMPGLPDSTRAALLDFVRAYPGLEFARYSETQIKSLESKHSLSFSGWLRQLLLAIPVVAPGKLKWIRLSGFDREPWASQELTRQWLCYGFTFKLSSEYGQLRLAGEPLLIVASKLETLHTIFAVKATSEDDRAVYLFGLDDIDPKGDVNPASAQAVFIALETLVGRIAAFKIQDERGKPNLIERARP